jgi:hypothetical protein
MLRKISLAVLFALFPITFAYSGVGAPPMQQSFSDMIIHVGGEIKGTAGRITKPETRTVIKRYRSIPGGGDIKGTATRITPVETRTVIKRYRSIPGGGDIKGTATRITPVETRTVIKRYRSIPGGGDIKGTAAKITPVETRTVVKRYRSIPGGGDIKGTATRITPAETRTVVKRYRSIPGGFLLEDSATGLPRFKSVRYDAAANALMFDGHLTYALPVSAAAAATLAKAIAADDRMGVSLGEDDEIIYGRLPARSDIAVDLKLADNFLGDMILPPQDRTTAYKFVNGHQPRQTIHRDTAVFFKFRDYHFAQKDGKLELATSAFDARIIPVLKKPAADGSYLPDFKAIEAGTAPDDFIFNADHIAQNINYYASEELISNVHAYGEVAALLRSLKKTNRASLRVLARDMEMAAAGSTRRFSADTLEGNWLEYLRDIQARNRFGNWSGPPADTYQGRVKNAAAPAN